MNILKNSILGGIAFSLTVLFSFYSYALVLNYVSWDSDIVAGSTLTADLWNKMQSNQNALNAAIIANQETDSITVSPSASKNLAVGTLIDNFRVVAQHGAGLTLSNDRITVNKSGTYQIIQSFLFNTGLAGGTGNTRIQINGVSYAGGYSYAIDSGDWEKSVATLVIYLNAGDEITVSMPTDEYIWGSASGYSHSLLSVVRIGL